MVDGLNSYHARLRLVRSVHCSVRALPLFQLIRFPAFEPHISDMLHLLVNVTDDLDIQNDLNFSLCHITLRNITVFLMGKCKWPYGPSCHVDYMH